MAARQSSNSHHPSTSSDLVGASSSPRQSLALSENDHELDCMGIADGRRPAPPPSTNCQASGISGDHFSERRTPPPRPSSVSKPPKLRRADSFALQHDGAEGHLTMPGSAALNRTTSASTVSSSEGPFGSSYAYQTDHSDENLAPATLATTSSSIIMSPERTYIGPRGPTHPYTMYPQNTAPTSEIADEDVAPIAGFPGHAREYRRRLGPDGEEIADMIGPDGHTEQLPPYTLYSDDAVARKLRPPPPTEASAPAVAGVIDPGATFLTNTDPDLESHENLHSPGSRLSTRSLVSSTDAPIANIPSDTMSEKPKLKHWQAVARRRLCGIFPIWAVVLAAIILIIFSMILATVLAVLKGRSTSDDLSEPELSSPTIQPSPVITTFDADPLSTVPAHLSALPTGTWEVPVSAPTLSQTSCLQDGAESEAWSCELPKVPLHIVVAQLQGDDPLNDYALTMHAAESNSPGFFQYGVQQPVLQEPQIMTLVTDAQEPERGPAWFFQAPYNKIVHLPERALNPVLSKRSLRDVAPGITYTRDLDDLTASPGDKPWICYWNGTLLETFIYVGQNSSSANETNSSKAASLSIAGDYYYDHPNVVKIMERRMPRGFQSVPPYCVKHVILDNYEVVPWANSTGQLVTVDLDETAPLSFSPMTSKRAVNSLEMGNGRRSLWPRQSNNNCGCVWLAN